MRRHCNTIVQYYLSIHNTYSKQYVTACVSYTPNHKPYVDDFPLNTTNFLVVFTHLLSTGFYKPAVFTLTDCIRSKTTAIPHECKRKYTKLMPPYCAKWLKFMLHANSLIIGGEIVQDSNPKIFNGLK